MFRATFRVLASEGAWIINERGMVERPESGGVMDYLGVAVVTPKVHIMNGDVFITYKGAIYTEDVFALIHPVLYKAFFDPTKTINFEVHHEQTTQAV